MSGGERQLEVGPQARVFRDALTIVHNAMIGRKDNDNFVWDPNMYHAEMLGKHMGVKHLEWSGIVGEYIDKSQGAVKATLTCLSPIPPQPCQSPSLPP
jgi:hypothetical protein